MATLKARVSMAEIQSTMAEVVNIWQSDDKFNQEDSTEEEKHSSEEDKCKPGEEKESAHKVLQNFAYNMRNTVRDDKIASKVLSADEKNKIQDAIDQAIHWLDNNQLAEADEIKAKMKELEDMCFPVMLKIYDYKTKDQLN